MKYIFFLLSFLLLIPGLIGCNSKGTTDKTVFRYNQVGGLETLDPAFAKNLSIMWGVKFIYNTLVEVDSSLKIQSSLAKNWEVSEDGLDYTFHLHSNVYFQDNELFTNGKGRKMTADDVVFSFERLVAPQTASSGAWIFNDRIRPNKPFEAIDDSTFVIHLVRPFGPLLEVLSMPYCAIVPKEVVQKWGKDFRNHPCGTGPFQMKYWDEGNTLVLHKNPNYWEQDEQGNRLPYLDAVQVSFNESKATEFLLFLQGNLDFVNGLDGSFKDIVLHKDGSLKEKWQSEIQLDKRIYLNTEYIGILQDTTSVTIKDSDLKFQLVRQAINYAIDRQKIVTYFRNGIGIPAEKGFVPIGMPGTEQSITKGYTYDPQKAQELLRKAGFPNGKGLRPIELLTPEGNVDVCNFIVSQLNNIGIPAKVQVMQPGILRQEMSRSMAPFFKAQWIADYPDAETYLAFFYSKLPAPPNYTRFENAQYDAWYEASMATTDDQLRLQLYGKMDSLASECAAIVPLFYDELLHFTHKNITGLKTTSLNMIDIKSVHKQ